MIRKLFYSVSIVLILNIYGLDSGGLTFDFAEYSDTLYKKQSKPTENFFPADMEKQKNSKEHYQWRTSVGIHIKDQEKRKNVLPVIREKTTFEFADNTITISKSSELKEICGEDVARVSGTASRYVKLPDTKGGRYRLSYDYRAEHSSFGANQLLALFYETADIPQRGPRVGRPLAISFADSADWAGNSVELNIPENTGTINFIFRIDGTGSLQFRNIRLERSQTSDPFSLTVNPHGILGGDYVLSQNQPALMAFIIRNLAGVILKEPELVLAFPESVKLEDISNDFASFAYDNEKKEYRIKFKPGIIKMLNQSKTPIQRFGVVLSTNAVPGHEPTTGSCRLEDDGKVISNRENVKFSFIPEIKTAKPKRYYDGMHTGGSYFTFGDKGSDLMSKFISDSGSRWVIAGRGEAEVWRRNGIEVVLKELYWLANGFRVGLRNRPEHDRFISWPGMQDKYPFNEGTCPAAVYEKRPFFMNQTMDYLKKNLTGFDGLWANWEPYRYANNGCFCNHCRDNFAGFVGVPVEDMKKDWPDELQRGRKYFDQGIRFRSLEHAKMVKTINENIINITGGDKSFGFIPGISIFEVSEGWRDRENGRDVCVNDYAAFLRWLDPWGPYPRWFSERPFVYKKALNLYTFCAARSARTQFDLDYPVGKRPKLMAFPNGYQGNMQISTPEGIAIDLDCFFFNGFDGSIIYYFPRGYDNRYFKAYAEHIEKTARYEDFVFDGKRQDDRVSLVPDSLFAVPCATIHRNLKDTEVSPLQHIAYELNSKWIVAVFNFWEKGECFFSLKLSGLPSAEKYHLIANGHQFASSKGYYTGSELAEGVPLHAGAVRCVVYELIPGKANGDFWTPERLADLRKERLPQLRKAKQEDDNYEKRFGVKISKITDIANAGITAKADNAKNQLIITASANSMILDTRVMNLIKWTTAESDVIIPVGNRGFGSAEFWHPLLRPEGFSVTSQEKIDAGIRIKAELRLTEQQSQALRDLIIRQTFDITDHCRKVTVITELENDTGDEYPLTHNFGMRYHLMPAVPALPGGVIKIGDFSFKRNRRHEIFSLGDKEFEAIAGKVFNIDGSPHRINSGKILFVSDKLSASLLCEPENQLAGFCLWDSSKQLTTSFEPCFLKKSLDNGNATTYKITMTIRE